MRRCFAVEAKPLPPKYAPQGVVRTKIVSSGLLVLQKQNFFTDTTIDQKRYSNDEYAKAFAAYKYNNVMHEKFKTNSPPRKMLKFKEQRDKVLKA